MPFQTAIGITRAEPDNALHKVLGRIGWEHEHYHISTMRSARSLVHHYMIADEKCRLHCARRYLVGLEEEAPQLQTG